MKIGYFISQYPYKEGYSDYLCGGAGNVAINLAKEMMKKGNIVYIFTTSRTKEFKFEKIDGIKIFRYGKNFKIADSYISLKLLIGPLKQDVDIIHTHMGNAPAPIAAYIYSILKNKPLIITYHGDQQSNYGNFIRRISLKINNIFTKLILRSADKIISPSRPFIDESKILPEFRKKIIVIPNGIYINEVLVPKTKEEYRKELGISIKSVIFLFVGSLSLYKGPDILLKSMNIVIRKIPNTMVIFVGKGQMDNKLKIMTKELNLQDNVVFTGFIDDNKKYKYLKLADVFVLPSTLNTEVFPIVLLEASAAKLPIVTSDLNTFTCIVRNGVNGIITKRNNYNDLANALVLLGTDEKLRNNMAENAYINIKDFSWKKIADDTENIYREYLY